MQGAITITAALAMTIGPLILLFSKLQKAIFTPKGIQELAKSATAATVEPKQARGVGVDEDAWFMHIPGLQKRQVKAMEEFKNKAKEAKENQLKV